MWKPELEHIYGVQTTLHILRFSSDSMSAANCCRSGVSLWKVVIHFSYISVYSRWFLYFIKSISNYLAQRSIPSLSSSLRTRLRFGRIAGTSLLWSLFTCRSGLEAFLLALNLLEIYRSQLDWKQKPNVNWKYFKNYQHHLTFVSFFFFFFSNCCES